MIQKLKGSEDRAIFEALVVLYFKKELVYSYYSGIGATLHQLFTEVHTLPHAHPFTCV